MDEGVQESTFAIDRSPQISAPGLYGDHHLVQMPRARRSRLQAGKVAGEGRIELHYPPPDHLIGHLQSSLGQEFFYITINKHKAQIQPDGLPGDPGLVLMTSIGDGLHSLLPVWIPTFSSESAKSCPSLPDAGYVD
jgi:hypothetical protein